MVRLEMRKIQFDINKEVAKISSLLLGITDKYEYFIGEEILHSNQKKKKNNRTS